MNSQKENREAVETAPEAVPATDAETVAAQTPEGNKAPPAAPAKMRAKERLKGKRRLWLILVDVCCLLIAYFVYAVFELIEDPEVFEFFSDWLNALLMLVVVMACRLALQVYWNVWRYPNVRAYLTMVLSDMCGGMLGYLASYALARAGVPYIYMGFWPTFSVVAIFTLSTLIMRFAYQMLYLHRNVNERIPGDFGSMKRIGIAIVGAGNVGRHLAEELRSSRTAHYHPVCFIDNDPAKIGARIAELKVYPEDDKILDRLNTLPVQEVFVAIPNLSPQENARIMKLYSDGGYKVKIYDFPTRATAGRSDGNVRRMVRDFRIEDLLGRESLEEKIDSTELEEYYRDKVVLVTGGGGSIGSEICRQVAKCRPARLIVLDIYENNAYEIQQELVRLYGKRLDICVEIASVRDRDRMDCVFAAYRPQVVFHAAAHKHVPLMEHSACEAVKNNVMGTYNTADMAEKYGVEKFVLISTDKAVNPTNVMGASKRMCEMVVQCRRDGKTAFTAVRFGNVLGSNGSVIPLFRKQIEQGGPVTVTDKRIIRYFMTIPEASRLVMAAGSMAKNGQLFVLDMGAPVRILHMAENMIRMMDYIPYEDIDIVEIGLRPGEKLYEELLIKTEELTKTDNSLIFIETDVPYTREEVDEKLRLLREAVEESRHELASPRIKEVMKQVVPTFRDPEEVNKTAEDTEEMKQTAAASH